jgi:hypothetical protein
MTPNASSTHAMQHSSSSTEVEAYRRLETTLRTSSIPEGQLLAQLPLFVTRVALSHMMFLSELYREILPLHGDILEFGCRWGRNLALLIELRTILEPHNFSRQVVGFDTFTGFASTDAQDGSDAIVRPGGLAVHGDWQSTLQEMLALHEALGPRPHVSRSSLVAGDASVTVPAWLAQNPGRTIAFAYFDMDLYKPTRDVLQAILPRLCRGAIIAFDEVNVNAFPGETVALLETIDLGKYRLRRTPYSGNQSFIVYGE